MDSAKGWSLQEFLLFELSELARRPDREAFVRQIERRRGGTRLTAAQLIEARDSERR